ncbi:uroporphyrinogen decarboxylase family protein [Haloimpatiens sp. FM7315]|uniref:uroporphyrinogen decarboxylase family protein n=1 Tax=Haloimpatiens sp. FM7315 TaxID=3298609 RepID=UPI0035A2E704
MDEKERLIRILKGESVDRPPVICPGGMMNAAVTEVVKNIRGNHNLEVDSMVEASKKVQELTGFENYGVPFCMTVEAEPMGVEVDFGDKNVEPRITKYNDDDIEEIMARYKANPLKDGRMPVVLEAIRRLKNDRIPVIGNLTGPMSTATSIIDPLILMKMLRKDPEKAYKFLKYVTEYSVNYVEEMIISGADVIAMSDPTATGEILGKKNFEKFIIPMYVEIVKAVHSKGKNIIIHICGDTKNILESLNNIGADALSFDSIVSMKYARNIITTRLMGNVSTQLLQDGIKEKIEAITENCIDSGADIVSPACGLGMSTSIDNLKAMTYLVKGRKYDV